MPVNPAYRQTIASGRTFYRITSVLFSRGKPATYRDVVNGQGAKKSKDGARYNYPGAPTVYLTEDLETCFAEKMFYFHREVVRGIDLFHKLGVLPPFVQEFALWEMILKRSIDDVANLNMSGAMSFFNVFPSLPFNPSQDYDHLKQARANLENGGYNGIVVGSSRAVTRGNMVVLFDDQSKNLASILPHSVEFRLIDEVGAPFNNHTTQILDFTAGEVRFTKAPPAGGAAYSSWQRVGFNH